MSKLQVCNTSFEYDNKDFLSLKKGPYFFLKDEHLIETETLEQKYFEKSKTSVNKKKEG